MANGGVALGRGAALETPPTPEPEPEPEPLLVAGEPGPESESGALGSGAVAGLVLGVVAGLTLLAFLLYGAFFGFGRRRRAAQSSPTRTLPPPRRLSLGLGLTPGLPPAHAALDLEEEEEEGSSSSSEGAGVRPADRLVSLEALAPDAASASVISDDVTARSAASAAAAFLPASSTPKPVLTA